MNTAVLEREKKPKIFQYVNKGEGVLVQTTREYVIPTEEGFSTDKGN